MLSILTDSCKRAADGLVEVIVEGDTFDELISYEAKRLALEAAAGLLGNGAISGMSGPFFPTKEGRAVETPDDVKQWRQDCLLNGGRTPRCRNIFTLRSAMSRF